MPYLPWNTYHNGMMTIITRVNELFLSLALLSTRALATATYYYYYFLSCIGFFDQWLICGVLDGCVVMWAGKTHVRSVHVYITTSEHNKVSDKTQPQEDTDNIRLFIKARTNSMLKYC